MATQAEKLVLAGVSGLLEGAADCLKKQAPAIRDAQIRRQVELSMTLVTEAQKQVDGVIGE